MSVEGDFQHAFQEERLGQHDQDEEAEQRRELADQRHDRIAEDLLARRGGMPLSRLFVVEEYPSDLMGFYGQGYSISRFLIEMGGRPRFLKFVRDGLKTGWDSATVTYYGLADVRELDRAWRSWHRVAARSTPTRDLVVVRTQSP